MELLFCVVVVVVVKKKKKKLPSDFFCGSLRGGKWNDHHANGRIKIPSSSSLPFPTNALRQSMQSAFQRKKRKMPNQTSIWGRGEEQD